MNMADDGGGLWRKRHELQHHAACIIGNAWRRYFTRKTFKALKDALYRAAAKDACRIMGARLYTETVLTHENIKDDDLVMDPADVTNRLEFVQYMSRLDRLPPHLGGRNNGWRELSFSLIPNQSIRFDATPKFVKERPLGAINIDMNRRQSDNQRPSIAEKRIKMLELDDDFGRLFEWTTMLDPSDLQDFISA
ncbi:putative protein CXorf58 [Blyttiomyces sp. JEL0837]|nr:putative protein CXorf58 [Blyttiomyces sp. JEL0837]